MTRPTFREKASLVQRVAALDSIVTAGTQATHLSKPQQAMLGRLRHGRLAQFQTSGVIAFEGIVVGHRIRTPGAAFCARIHLQTARDVYV